MSRVLARQEHHGHTGHAWLSLPVQIHCFALGIVGCYPGLHYCKSYPDFGSPLFDVSQDAPEDAKTLEQVWEENIRQKLYFSRTSHTHSHVLLSTLIVSPLLWQHELQQHHRHI